MSDHDPLCNWYGDDEPPGDWCQCTMYAAVRADERERIAQAIEAHPVPESYDVGYRDGYIDAHVVAARIARRDA